VSFILNTADGGSDLFGCSLGAFGEATDLAGDHGETAAVFAGAGSFDGGVKGEQIGLFADFLDDADHFADFLRAKCEGVHLFGNCAGGFGNFFHGAGGGFHHGATLISSFGGYAAGGGSALGIVAYFGDGGGHLLRRRSDLIGLI